MTSTKTKKKKLHCEAGDHDWSITPRKGRYPRSCPKHLPVKDTTPGDPLEKARAAKAKKSRKRDQDTIREIMASQQAATCSCGITPTISMQALRSLNAGCTGSKGFNNPGYVCPTLDRVRRALGV